MSFNSNFNNNFCGNNFTFQGNFMPPFIPPPPLPPPFFIPSITGIPPEISDHEFIKQFETKITPEQNVSKCKISQLTINEVREKLRKIVLTLNNIKDKEKILSENINSLKEEDWLLTMKLIEEHKIQINESLASLNDSHLNIVRKLIAKRSAKRLRLKKIYMARKRDKEAMIREREERSRKINENLQKIKDEINKAKQEEKAKLEADIVLKEVLRKKHDAKKCVVKLEALVKLRRARLNTARGRGELVSETEDNVFNSNIEKLKSLWNRRLVIYEKEECELRAKLKHDNKLLEKSAKDIHKDVESDLAKWREFLFGDADAVPQNNFNGDVGRFVHVRSEWDQYISTEGSSLPVGWVLPTLGT